MKLSIYGTKEIDGEEYNVRLPFDTPEQALEIIKILQDGTRLERTS